MKSIKELPHAYKIISGVYVMIDEKDTDFKFGTSIQKVHYSTKDCVHYIWFNRTTYSLKGEE